MHRREKGRHGVLQDVLRHAAQEEHHGLAALGGVERRLHPHGEEGAVALAGKLLPPEQVPVQGQELRFRPLPGAGPAWTCPCPRPRARRTGAGPGTRARRRTPRSGRRRAGRESERSSLSDTARSAGKRIGTWRTSEDVSLRGWGFTGEFCAQGAVSCKKCAEPLYRILKIRYTLCRSMARPDAAGAVSACGRAFPTEEWKNGRVVNA